MYDGAADVQSEHVNMQQNTTPGGPDYLLLVDFIVICEAHLLINKV